MVRTNLRHTTVGKQSMEKEKMQHLFAENERTEYCCKEHKRRLELFCQEDESFVCVLCIPTHSTHSFVFLQDAVIMYEDSVRAILSSLEFKVTALKHFQNKHETELVNIQGGARSLEQHIMAEFEKLHQFLQDKEQNLIQQLNSIQAQILTELKEELGCIKIEELECIKNDVTVNRATQETLSTARVQQELQDPVNVLTVPKNFEDVAVTFSEEEWKMLKNEDKDLYREVMEQNYKTLISLGYKIPKNKLLLLFKGDKENPKHTTEVKHTIEKKEHSEDNPNSVGITESSVNRNPQPLLGSSQLCHKTEDLQHCTQPVNVAYKLPDTPVPQHCTKQKSSKSSECNKTCTIQQTPVVCQKILTEEKPFECTDCNKCFTKRSKLAAHRRVHTGERPYKCTECSKSFTMRSSLKTHQRFHSGQTPYQCSECGKSFTQESTLIVHKRVHTGEKPYKCTECNKSFTQRGTLTTHQRFHSGEKLYTCTECNKSFTRLNKLLTHERVHTGEKPYKCADCNKSFTQQSSLKMHVRLHSGEKRYKCAKCSKCFTWHNQLLRHESTHTGEKPYKCAHCSKCFTLHRFLVRHRVIHTGEKQYKCTECRKSFIQRSNFLKHQQIHMRKVLQSVYKTTSCVMKMKLKKQKQTVVMIACSLRSGRSILGAAVYGLAYYVHQFCGSCANNLNTHVSKPCLEFRLDFSVKICTVINLFGSMVRRHQILKKVCSKVGRENIDKQMLQNQCANKERPQHCCGKHRRRLELFCQEDESFACVHCVPTHPSHCFVLLREAVNVYKDKVKLALAALESRAVALKNLQNKQEKELLDIQEDAHSVEQYITEEFAKLHQFLQEKEQNLIQQLKSEEAKSLNKFKEDLELIKGDMSATKEMASVTDTQLEEDPVDFLSVPKAFEDVAVTFSEEEWKLLRKQDKELHREVMLQNYETLVSIGYRIPRKKLLLLFKAEKELPSADVEQQNATEHKDRLEDNSKSTERTEYNVSYSHQPLLWRTQLHHKTENLTLCSQPVRSFCKSPVTPEPQPCTKQEGSKNSETDNVTVHQSSKICDQRQIVENGYKCGECNKCFPQRKKLAMHKRVHTGEKPYKCVVCSKHFTQSSNLSVHKRLHTGEKPFKCYECHWSFARRGNLLVHQRVHTGEKPYGCDECGKCFAQQNALIKHRRVHTGEKPYKCDECSKSFTQQNGLIKHHRVHTGEKPYKCADCSRSFRQRYQLKKHEQVHMVKKQS
ncbi:zinc finger protein 665-like [Protopterus annectens]|uniref:zinc finger protein 665-like n=1 Tax=Protopterus annectens TaxID=7888 RepID=UPI001CFAD660|nr:zinc finger protein 665-like [Protopterus annectens]